MPSLWPPPIAELELVERLALDDAVFRAYVRAFVAAVPRERPCDADVFSTPMTDRRDVLESERSGLGSGAARSKVRFRIVAGLVLLPWLLVLGLMAFQASVLVLAIGGMFDGSEPVGALATASVSFGSFLGAALACYLSFLDCRWQPAIIWLSAATALHLFFFWELYV